MNNLKILILFNIILICLLYKLRDNILIIFPFVFALLISLNITFIYNKNVEGNLIYNTDDEVYSLWDNLDDDRYQKSDNKLMNKINKFIKVLLDYEEKIEEKTECKGEFIIDKTDRNCGYNVYDEKTWKITKQGLNCKHRAGYKEREFKPLCKLNEKCEENQDCSKGKCANGTCKIDFECKFDKLNNCDEKSCNELNDIIGYDKYKYSNNKCRINSCNQRQYYNCDKEGCSKLGYKYMWDDRGTPDSEDDICVLRDLPSIDKDKIENTIDL